MPEAERVDLAARKLRRRQRPELVDVRMEGGRDVQARFPSQAAIGKARSISARCSGRSTRSTAETLSSR